MKKLFIIYALIFFATTVYADDYKTCKVNNTTGSVVVNTFDLSDDTVQVTFANDTEIYVNVTAQIRLNSNEADRTITKMVAPRSETTVNLKRSIKGVSKVISVSGTKCQ